MVTGLKWRGVRLAAAPGLVPLLLELDKFGQPGDQSSDFLCLIVGQPPDAVAISDKRLAIHIRQPLAIGIGHTIAAGDWLKSP